MIDDLVLSPLVKAMDGLKAAISEAMAFADKAQKASLALGSTYEDTRVQLGGTMEGLRGDLNQRFGAAIAGMEAGLQGNTAGIAKLINQQQLTGTAFRATAKSMATLEATLGLSRNDTNQLSENLIQTGSDYTISTDKLVGAIDALKATFPAQKLAGMGAEVMEAVTLLQAELGPQLAGPLQSVMTMVMDSSLQGYERLQLLGIEDVRGRLAAARSSAEAQQILKDAFVKASDSFKSISGGLNTSFLNIAAASETFGNQTINFTTVADGLGKRIKKEDKDLIDFGKTLTNLRKEALTPFKEAFSLAYPFLLEAVDTFSALMNALGERFKAFAESLGGEEGAAASMKQFKLFVVDVATAGIVKFEAVFRFMDRFVTEIIPNVFDSIVTPFNNFTKIGGSLDKIKFFFFSVLGEMGKFFAFLMDEEGMVYQGLVDILVARNEAEERVLSTGMDKESFERKYGKQDPTIREQLAQARAAAIASNPESEFFKDLQIIRENIENEKPLRMRSLRAVEEIDRKTPDIKTSPEFLDETANMLGRSIEGILGIGRDSTAEEMLEELRIANEQRELQRTSRAEEFTDPGN